MYEWHRIIDDTDEIIDKQETTNLNIEIYANTPSSCLASVQIAQNKAVRALFGFPKQSSTIQMYMEINLVMVKPLWKIRTATLVWFLLNQSHHLNIFTVLTEYCAPMSHKYPTRDKLNFNLTYHKPSYANSGSFKLFLLWNSIPPTIKSLGSLSSFKKSIKTLFTLSDFSHDRL